VSDQDQQEEHFWQMVDAFVDKANELSDGQDLGLVASALMQANARFSAFYVASSSESRKDFKEDIDSTIQDFGRSFKQRLASDLDDYHENYKIYLAEKTDEDDIG